MEDCFAYHKSKCKILVINKCKEIENCSFYKTKRQVEEGQRKAIERILSLDREKIKYICERYYNGELEVD